MRSHNVNMLGRCSISVGIVPESWLPLRSLLLWFFFRLHEMKKKRKNDESITDLLDWITSRVRLGLFLRVDSNLNIYLISSFFVSFFLEIGNKKKEGVNWILQISQLCKVSEFIWDCPNEYFWRKISIYNWYFLFKKNFFFWAW